MNFEQQYRWWTFLYFGNERGKNSKLEIWDLEQIKLKLTPK